MAKIHTPVEGYTGISANLLFVGGVAETDDPHLIAWFKSKGYRVTGEKAEQPEKAETAKPKTTGDRKQK